MPWLSLTFELEAAAAEALSDSLLAEGASSAHIEPCGNDLSKMQALLPIDAPADDVVRSALRMAGLPDVRYTCSRVEDADWVRQSQAQFSPAVVGRLWIGPTWCEAPHDDAILVRLDPGLAFGTGSHPSTRLALRFVDRFMCGGEDVLDYGCGSGILAIAAAKLGAARVDAVDLDPQALATTTENASVNAVAVRTFLPAEHRPFRYDLVVANILAQPLIVLAPLLGKCVRRGGRIGLSGILQEQACEVARAYEPDFACTIGAAEEGWALVEGERR
ncbi:MAG: 50S ribosomal protein L11 methyltransferase [Betaproteobacteria bacterium]|nr:50S ribosomal protein L11 methyltransferase [Betaproteobacteria bacterium]